MSHLKLLLLIVMCMASSVVKASGELDSLQQLLLVAQNDTSKVRLLNEMSACLWYSDPSASIEYAEEALLLAQKNNYQSGLLKAYNNIGVINDGQGNYSDALKCFTKTLEISRDLNNEKALSQALNNIGVLYESLYDYDLALEYHKQSLEIKQKLGDEEGIGFAYNNMGVIYKELGETGKALDYHLKALEIREKTGYQRGIANSSNNLGRIYLQLNMMEDARRCFNRALGITKKIGDKSGEAFSLLNLAQVYHLENNHRKAIGFASLSYKIYKALNTKQELKEASKLLFQTFAYLHDYQNAYRYQNIYLNYHDSLISENNKKRIEQLQSSIEIQKRDKEIMMLSKDKMISEAETRQLNAEAERKNLFLFASFSFLAFLILMATILVRHNKQQRKVNQLLQKKNKEIRDTNLDLQVKNKEIELRNKEVWEQKKSLEELNSIKDKLFSIIAHDFRSPLNSLQGTLSLVQMEAISYDELKSILPDVIFKVDHTVSLLDNLLNWARTQMSGMETNPECFNLQAVIEENVHLVKTQATEKGVLIHNLIPSMVSVFADQEMIKLVVRNILTNAVKFTSSGDVISTRIEETPGNYRVAIADTGCGIDRSKLGMLFEPGKSTLGTSNEKGTGLGLWMCKDFVEKNGGKIWAESERGKGSTFYFTIPKGEKMQREVSTLKTVQGVLS